MARPLLAGLLAACWLPDQKSLNIVSARETRLTEKFSAYGFQVEIPEDWRIEFNAKNSRQRGDVAFHSPKNNVFFVSWGKLEDAQRRVWTLGEVQGECIKRVRSGP